MPRSIVAVGALATHRSNNSSTRPDVRLHYYPNQDFEGKTETAAWRDHLPQTHE